MYNYITRNGYVYIVSRNDKFNITQYCSTVYIGIAMVYYH